MLHTTINVTISRSIQSCIVNGITHLQGEDTQSQRVKTIAQARQVGSRKQTLFQVGIPKIMLHCVLGLLNYIMSILSLLSLWGEQGEGTIFPYYQVNPNMPDHIVGIRDCLPKYSWCELLVPGDC